MTEAKTITILEAIPELEALERYLMGMNSSEENLDKTLLLILARAVDKRLEELTDQYELEVNSEEQFFTDDLLEFMKKKSEFAENTLSADSAETEFLSDSVPDHRLIITLLKEGFNGKERMSREVIPIFLLLVRATKEKLKYFQEKYNWKIRVNGKAPEKVCGPGGKLRGLEEEICVHLKPLYHSGR
jgi:hypothetical protein